jgi:L-ribulose-5-phosphate 3-epimerase
MNRIALIPDEYTNDPATAFELGRRWGIEDFELRYAHRWRVPFGPPWLAEGVARAVADYGVNVIGISPGLFKPVMRADGTKTPLSLETPDEIRRHLDELLPLTFRFAEKVATRNVTVFALPRGGAPVDAPLPQIAIDTLAAAAERASSEGFQLLLENGTGSWAQSAAETAAVLKAVGSPALRLTWDAPNVAHAGVPGDPVADGYPLVRKFVANVHVKDVAFVDGKPAWTMLGEGIIDWPGQLAMLAADGYDGPITLEPHLQYNPQQRLNLAEKVEAFLNRLRGLLAQSRR